jgi:two-component system CheB/CheR fusion protein
VHLNLPKGINFLDDVAHVVRTGDQLERSVRLDDGRHLSLRILPYIGAPGDPPTGVIVTFIDITELKVALQRTQSVLDSLPEEIAMLDRDGTILMVNEAWRTFALRNGAKSVASVSEGANYLEACRSAGSFDKDVGAVIDGLAAVLIGTSGRFTFEYPCHSQGGKRWFLMHAAPLSGQLGAVVSHIDITTRVQAEEELVIKTRRGEDCNIDGGVAVRRG